jgi:hypothetical protein
MKINICFLTTFFYLLNLYLSNNSLSEENYTFKIQKGKGEFKNKIRKKFRELDDNHNKIAEIYGNSSSLNYYFVNIYIGNPPKRQAVIIDTGSHLTSVPCMPLCESCGKHLNSYYTISSNIKLNHI